MTEVDRQLNLTDTEEDDLDHTLKTTGHGAEEEGGVHPEVSKVSGSGLLKPGMRIRSFFSTDPDPAQLKKIPDPT